MQQIQPDREDITRMFGTMEDHRALEILGLQPSYGDLEVALAYLNNMSDVMGEERLPLSGTAAGVYEIVTRDDPFDDD